MKRDEKLDPGNGVPGATPTSTGVVQGVPVYEAQGVSRVAEEGASPHALQLANGRGYYWGVSGALGSIAWAEWTWSHGHLEVETRGRLGVHPTRISYRRSHMAGVGDSHMHTSLPT